MAKKKTVKKKASAKQDGPSEPIVTEVGGRSDLAFDIMSDQGALAHATAMSLLAGKAAQRTNRSTDFRTMSEVRRETIMLPEFQMQWWLGNYGLPKPALIEIIAQKGLGKSTLLSYFAGAAIKQCGSPVLFLECEGKPLAGSRVMRTMHTDPAIAAKMTEMITWKQISTLMELEEVLLDFVRIWRGEIKIGNSAVKIPKSTPLMVIVDPFSKLLSKGEAQGLVDVAKMKADKQKMTGEGSNLEHSKWASGFTRRLGYILEEYNLILMVSHHQTVKIDMSGKGGPAMAESVASLYNTTKIGGQGMDQTAALMLTMAYGGLIKDGSRNNRGKKILARVEKNSYGPGNRQMNWELREEHAKYDTPSHLDPALHFEDSWATWMANERHLATTVASKRFSCKELNVTGATCEQFHQAFHANPEVANRLGKALRLEGYYSIVDELRRKDEEEEEVDAGTDQTE